MADEKSTTIYRDMLDIIFANRNKAYGAYQLRRDYPKYLGRALGFSLGLIVLVFALPLIMQAVSGLLPKDKPVDVVAELGPPPDIDPNNPPPPPPPPPPTPPPPTRTTQKYVPPIFEEKAEEEPQKAVEELLETKDDIGKEDKKGNDEAPPATDEAPSLDPVIEAPKVEEKNLRNVRHPEGAKLPWRPGRNVQMAGQKRRIPRNGQRKWHIGSGRTHVRSR